MKTQEPTAEVEQVQPKYVSCIIQINIDDSWVYDSPYIHVFDDLDKVHYQMERNWFN